MIGSASERRARLPPVRENSRPNSMARFWLAIAASVEPSRNCRDSSGSSDVPMAMPTTPSGSWLMRSA